MVLSFPLRERSERVGLSACVKHGHVVQSTNCYWLVQSVVSHSMEDDLWWKMTSVARWPLWMTTFDGRFLQDDGFGPSFFRSSSFLRLSQCLMSYSFLEDDLHGRRPLMEDNLWWKTTLDGSPNFCERLSFHVLFCTLKTDWARRKKTRFGVALRERVTPTLRVVKIDAYKYARHPYK